MSALNQVKKFAVTLSDSIFGSSKHKIADKQSSTATTSDNSGIQSNTSVRIIADKQTKPKQQLSDFTLF